MMELHFIFLPDDTVHLSGFGRDCADVLELDVELQVHAVLFHDLLFWMIKMGMLMYASCALFHPGSIQISSLPI
jgi:hypothetical protein